MSQVTTDMNCSSYCETSTATLTWTIDKIYSQHYNSMESSVFTCGKTSWSLKIYPNMGNMYTSIELKLQSNDSEKTYVEVLQFSLSIIDKQGIKTCQKVMHGRSFDDRIPVFSWLNFVKKKYLLENEKSLLPNGDLTIFAKLVIKESPFINEDEPPKKRLRSLADDHNNMFINATFSDLTIVCEEKEIKVHRYILAARSPVFFAMLNNQMQEAAENSVKISDIDYDVVMELMRFFYTGRIDKIKELAAKLLYAADKYQVNDLKELCEDVLRQQLSVENVCDILVLADLHSCDRLEVAALEFIRLKVAEVTESEGFDRLTQAHLVKKIVKATTVKISKCDP